MSNRGLQFASQVMKELYRIIKVDRKMSTAYHPQTDGETERVNQELEGYLRIFGANNPETWASHLHMAEFAHNSKEHSARGMSPFFIQMGYNPKIFPTTFEGSNVPVVEQRLKEIQKI